ncbi:hypothetical protein [Psychrobacter raelei]|uniref:hypothetical protein n=1 Tax=Psychrobacter raelei TaxID=2565531 RepID=UPI003F63C307
MTQPLIEKLHHLDSILHDIRQRYDASHSELLSLKNGPQIDPNEVERLQQQLTESQAAYEQAQQTQQQLEQELSDTRSAFEQAQQEHSSLEQVYNQLNDEHQSLVEAHTNLNDSYSELLQKCEALEASNHALLEKNRLAREHTKVVMHRLTLIDQAAD